MTRNRSSYALIGAVLSVILVGCPSWSEGPAWADSLAGGGAAGGDGLIDGAADGSAGGGTYQRGYGRADGGAGGVAAGRARGRAYQGRSGGANGFGGVAAGFEYNPVINRRDFVHRVDNKYFTLRPGASFTYEKITPQGVERNVAEVSGRKRRILGVATTEVRDRVWLNGQLKEDARDWYAQDRRGNVWYFGEAVDNYENGRLKDHKGSWEAGVNGAQAGIIMLKDPIVGVTYRQEFARGTAEDMASVIALNQTVTVPAGTFRGCLQTRDWSNIDAIVGDKFYCPAVGFMTLEESVPRSQERHELISVSGGGARIASSVNGGGNAGRLSRFSSPRRISPRY